ncbi:MAG TPA: hypothetical protein VMW38_25465, partial [Terriglobia bacterium]|nr:hypothetical protein [Terriglobia bacterium]
MSRFQTMGLRITHRGQENERSNDELDWVPQRVVISIIISLVIGLLGVGCGTDCNVTTQSQVSAYQTARIIDTTGRIVIDAHCPDGVQMIGGGFSLDDTTGFAANKELLILEANYPADLKTWRVILFNPDLGHGLKNNYGTGVVVECYGIHNPDLHLGMKIDSVGPHDSGNDISAGIYRDFTVDCPAPKGSVVTSGGFKMEPDPSVDESSFEWEHPIWGSYPSLQDGYPIGWSTHYGDLSVHRNRIFTYVLYSRGEVLLNKTGSGSTFLPVLESGPTKILDAATANVGSDFRTVEPQCDQGFFCPGGGWYNVWGGDANNPGGLGAAEEPHSPFLHSRAYSQASGKLCWFGGWSFEGNATFNNHESSAGSTSAHMQSLAVQIKNLPPSMEVHITSPAGGSYINQQVIKQPSPGIPNPPLSNQVTFDGYAIDYDGTRIDQTNFPGNFHWQITGATNYTGDPYNTQIR